MFAAGPDVKAPPAGLHHPCRRDRVTRTTTTRNFYPTQSTEDVAMLRTLCARRSKLLAALCPSAFESVADGKSA